MKRLKIITVLFIAVCTLFAVNVTALAAEAGVSSEVPDYSRTGSITVDMLSADTEKAISGGTLTLYEVAAARQENGNNIFEFTDDFRESGVNLDGISESDTCAKELVSRLKDYAKSRKITGKTVTVDKNGQASWTDLELGLYLVVNSEAADGYEPINAFLITVPRYLEGICVYDVSASPKQEAVKTTSAKTPSTPKTPVKTYSPGEKLPQTGQLWWPVPILASTGLLFLLFGWNRRRCSGWKSAAH